MKLTDLAPIRFAGGLAFLCPCCQREYLVVTLQPTSYAEQRRIMSEHVNVDKASWVPAPAFEAHAAANEDDLNKITLRPSIDASAAGHWKGFVSNGQCE